MSSMLTSKGEPEYAQLADKECALTLATVTTCRTSFCPCVLSEATFALSGEKARRPHVSSRGRLLHVSYVAQVVIKRHVL